MLVLRLLVLAMVLAFIALLASPVVLLYQGVQPEPLVPPSSSARHEDVGRIKALLRAHDPRTLHDGETRTITVSQRDLSLALRAALPRADQQSSRVVLASGRGRLDYSLQLPDGAPGAYLNLSLEVLEQDGELSLARVRAGDLTVPGWLLNPGVALADNLLKLRFAEYRGARDSMQRIALGEGEASFTYRWDKALAKQIEQRGRSVFLPPADRDRALAYYQLLASTSHRVGTKASLAVLLQPLFTLAGQRSGDGDAGAEQRALFLVLGTVLNRSSMHRLVGGDPADLQPGHRYVRWSLADRGDLAQHFGVSAAIAAAGGGVLADTIGVFKELDDSRGGSGFSFADLLADRAGVELAKAAMGVDAVRIQRAMASPTLSEADFMPPIDDLPEGLMEMEFKQRYRDLDDARYARVKREIDTRIARLPVYN